MPGAWRSSADVPELGPTDIHLWRADLRGGAGEGPDPAAVLSPEERARAERFRSPADGRRWMTARACLRRILGGYLGLHPAEVVIAVGATKKPELGGIHGGSLQFNLSHSGATAFYGIARHRSIGVDVERVRDDLDVMAVAGRVLDDRALAELRATGTDERIAQFFRLWVRHEAGVKCRGTGLGEQRRAGTDREARATAATSVFNVEIGPGYAAAYAFGEPDRQRVQVRVSRWEADR